MKKEFRYEVMGVKTLYIRIQEKWELRAWIHKNFKLEALEGKDVLNALIHWLTL